MYFMTQISEHSNTSQYILPPDCSPHPSFSLLIFQVSQWHMTTLCQEYRQQSNLKKPIVLIRVIIFLMYVLVITYQGKHMIFISLRLPYFVKYNGFQLRSFCYKRRYVILFLIANKYPIVYIYHIIFIQSSVDGDLG